VGVTSTWQEEILLAINELGQNAQLINAKPYELIKCSEKLYLHLIPLSNEFNPADVVQLQESYERDEKMLVHLWEDVWRVNNAGVISRVKSFLGLNKTFHARKAVISELEVAQAAKFFNDNHLHGQVNAAYYYGLLIDNELISMASFSALRPMKLKGPKYTSAELIRYASKDGCTITGGLSKLIKHFMKNYQPNDLMSYADRDWSLGKGYSHLGFELTATTEPAYLYVEVASLRRYFPHRLPKKILSAFDEHKELNLATYLANKGFVQVFNTGNLKYHLYT
jgi:hypothetical protein